MGRVSVDLDESIISALGCLDRPVDQVAREMIVLELYRRSAISAGTAAAALSLALDEFLGYAGRLGIPSIRMSEDEWAAEAARIAAAYPADR
jgi:hypothetical protein